MNRSTTPSRILAAAGITLALVAVTGGPASAVSAPIPYSCTFDVAGTPGSGDATAVWDSAIPDEGISVPPGTRVPLDPYTGSVDLPDAFVEALRTQGVTEFGGIGTHAIEFDWWARDIDLTFPATPVPATGPMTVAVTAVDAGSFSHSDAEPYTLVASARGFSLGTDDGSIAMSCVPSDYRADSSIDRVTVTLAPTTTPATPTTTAPATASAGAAPSATESAVRPALVQTDQPQTGPSALPLVALGLAAVALGGGLVAVRTGRARRH